MPAAWYWLTLSSAEVAEGIFHPTVATYWLDPISGLQLEQLTVNIPPVGAVVFGGTENALLVDCDMPEEEGLDGRRRTDVIPTAEATTMIPAIARMAEVFPMARFVTLENR